MEHRGKTVYEVSTEWKEEISKDLFGCPPIWISFPDMIEVDRQ